MLAVGEIMSVVMMTTIILMFLAPGTLYCSKCSYVPPYVLGMAWHEKSSMFTELESKASRVSEPYDRLDWQKQKQN